MKQPQRLMHVGNPRVRELLASLDEDVPFDRVAGGERVLRALGVPAGSSAGSLSERMRAERPVRSRRLILLASLACLTVACAVGWVVSQRGAGTMPPAPESAGVALAGVGAAAAATAGAAPAAAPATAEGAPAASNDAPSRGVDVHVLASALLDSRAGVREPGAGPLEPRMPRAGVRREPETAGGPSANVAAARDREAATADELGLLEQAQAAASRGRGDDALSLVDRHRREFPHGRFRVEMSVIEIEALARSGRLAEATARGERFLASHPGSPYTRRVEAVVRSRETKEQSR